MATALLGGLGACTMQPMIPDDQLVAFYAQTERQLVASGRMRTEAAPADAKFSLDDLVENFVRIALYDEFAVSGGRFVPTQSSSPLRRWTGPVRVGLIFGNSVADAQVEEDVKNVRRFTQKLASLSKIDMQLATRPDSNFTVLFLNRAEQRAFGDDLSAMVPNAPQAVVNAFRDSPAEAFCVAYTFGRESDGAGYGAALILVKAEHRGLMRLSCIHEEMAQAMGLANDSLAARPSIFNDDEEFALLTRHDEILMRMLYDKRLKPGMTEAEARPLLPQIARDAVRAAGARNLLIN